MLHFTFGDEPYQEGESVDIQCSVSTGDIPINITWWFEGKLLTSTDDVTIANIGRRASALSIDQVSWKHVGKYTCIGKNRAGLASHSSVLLVNGLSVLKYFPVNIGIFFQYFSVTAPKKFPQLKYLNIFKIYLLYLF